ncbi:hypothetical protein L484_012126 [Morus notabilis]|uniref:Short-chain dehydrogenase TIC 32 n=1 Tax=Morus notabilis TaxID=981085 RepID=W9RDB8_9ROSA|nr:hypothetical protein L484_012126 [Morus notabilis]
MKKTSQQSGKEGRIVNVSSAGHRFTYREGIRFEQINDPSGYGKLGAAGYGQSKLANILHANELARRLKEEAVNITANSLHPGAIATNIFRYNAIVNGREQNLSEPKSLFREKKKKKKKKKKEGMTLGHGRASNSEE